MTFRTLRECISVVLTHQMFDNVLPLPLETNQMFYEILLQSHSLSRQEARNQDEGVLIPRENDGVLIWPLPQA